MLASQRAPKPLVQASAETTPLAGAQQSTACLSSDRRDASLVTQAGRHCFTSQ